MNKYDDAIKYFLKTGNSLNSICREYKVDAHTLKCKIRDTYNINAVDYIKKKRNEKIESLYIEFSSNNESMKSFCKVNKISVKTFMEYINNRENDNIVKKDKYSVNVNYFDRIDSEEKAYWLGFLMADGYNSGSYVQLAISSLDYNHIKKFRNSLSSNHKIRFKHQDNTSCISIADKKMCLDLSSLGVVRGKTFSCNMPGTKSLPRVYMRDYIRGLFDGDGCIHKMIYQDVTSSNSIKRKIDKVSIIIKCESFVDQVIKAIKSICGITVGKYYHNVNKTFEIYIQGQDSVLKFLNCIYKESSMYLDRKFAQYLSYILPSDLEIDEIISAKLSGKILPDYDYDMVPPNQSYVIRTIRTEGTQFNELNYGDIIDSRNTSQGQSVESEDLS